ncbi:hypothetical protein P43SY_010000 [Pythium insidiosum]|uniref:Uncharacterized protein n=1 Tax=Pythium insidiosum TaxID=114742 RepID=A0AAD5Q508_PYTIN|nr:hypothetical protein P43SY_010000 [Pythium insidiosum]
MEAQAPAASVTEDVAVAGVAAAAEAATPQDGAGILTPHPVPFLRHDLFAVTKRVCSTPDGLVLAKKNAVTRVLQELRKGRGVIAQQLQQLEKQLLHVSDFLQGDITELSLAPAVHGSGVLSAGPPDTATDAFGPLGKGKAAVATSDKSNPLNPVASLVEEDLASDTPCTTVGLWRYLSFFPFFKPIALEDIDDALQLEDPRDAAQDAAIDDPSVTCEATICGHEMVEELSPLGGSLSSRSVDEVLRARLLASLLPPQSASEFVVKHDLVKEDAENGDSPVACEISKPIVDGSYNPPAQAASSTAARLRAIGLLDTDQDIVLALSRPEDDEVSAEIRCLQRSLATQLRRNNEFKRALRHGSHG